MNAHRYLDDMYGGPFTRICWPGETTLHIIGSRDEQGVLTLRYLHAPECPQWDGHDESGKKKCWCAQTVFHSGPGAMVDVENFLQRLREVTGFEPVPDADEPDDDEAGEEATS